MNEQRSLRGAERIIDRFLRAQIHKGKLTVAYPSGQRRNYGDKSAGVTVKIKSLPLAKLRNPTLFAGESYMSGNIDIAADKLESFFKLMSDNPSTSAGIELLQKLPKRQRNTKRNQRRQVSHHYDIGNDYYRLWLDKTLTYSCAYFQKPSDSLEIAQRQKIDHLLRKLQLKPGYRLLDIGCGWGYLAVAAAKQYGAKVLGITLSQEQLVGARKLAEREGVSELVSFELLNYQDIPDTERFDRIISVGMFEHVGRGNHATYFEKVGRLLSADGVSVLHTITQMTDKKASPWIDKYIFPGGYLPTIDAIEHLLAKQEFWSIDRENLWEHYARTLEIWRARHQAHRQEIIDMFDETFYRMQDFWLAGSVATFKYGSTGINQFIFTKNKPAHGTWPLTRDYLA